MQRTELACWLRRQVVRRLRQGLGDQLLLCALPLGRASRAEDALQHLPVLRAVCFLHILRGPQFQHLAL